MSENGNEDADTAWRITIEEMTLEDVVGFRKFLDKMGGECFFLCFLKPFSRSGY
jgi:hypothetical protein